MKYAIVTGVSKGLGASTAKYLLESGIHVIGISRTENDGLHLVATENNMRYEHFACDLGKLEALVATLHAIQYRLQRLELTSLYVVNNAAVVDPIRRASETDVADLTNHYHVNVLAPMILTNDLLKTCGETNFIGVNITSGAANRPIFGWSAYCSAKASVDMYTKAVALEQDELHTNHKVIAFSPGVMDTDMQAQIRSTDQNQFIDIDTFKNYKDQNVLSDTDAVASVLVDIITDEVNIENGKIYNVQDYF